MENDRTARWITILSFTALGLVAFPYAVASHMHLYADGAYTFAFLVGGGRLPPTDLLSDRSFTHVVTQLPTLLALRAGLTSVTTLSLIFGVSLYYLPFACYAAAAFLLLRKGMNTQAILLTLLYVVLIYFTSCFIIHESQFSSGLFALTLTIIIVLPMHRIGPLLLLVCIGVVAFSSYAFWVVFFPICIALFLRQVVRQPAPPWIRSIQVLVVFLYAAGAVLSVVQIVLTPYPDLRDSLLASHLLMVWRQFVAACLFFGAVALLSNRGLISTNEDSDWQAVSDSPASAARAKRTLVPSWVLLCGAIAAFEFVYFHAVPVPWNAYPLRSLQLALPAIFAFSFLALGSHGHELLRARAIGLYCVLPMLLLAIQVNFYQTAKWTQFRGSFLTILQQRSGYVRVDEVAVRNDSFLWGWTSPSLSIVLQAMQGADVRAILFNPRATWQPYGPNDVGGAIWLTHNLHNHFKINHPSPSLAVPI